MFACAGLSVTRMGLLNRLIDFDPIIDRAVAQANAKVPTLLDAVEKRLMALLPIIVAAAVKAVADQVRKDVPVVGNVLDIAEQVRVQVYLNANDYVQLGYNNSAAMATAWTMTGSADNAQSYFEISLLNRSTM